MNVEVSAALDHGPRDQASLRDAHNVDLLARKVRVVVELVADGCSLPFHALENRRRNAITDFDALDHCLVVNGFGDLVGPGCLGA